MKVQRPKKKYLVLANPFFGDGKKHLYYSCLHCGQVFYAESWKRHDWSCPNPTGCDGDAMDMLPVKKLHTTPGK